MAEVAKRHRETVKHKVGSRISVGRTHFDYGDSVYSGQLPLEFQKFYGTITFTYSTKCTVKWDIDRSSTDELYKDLKLEATDLCHSTQLQ